MTVKQDLFAKCGYNCGRCPSYKDNIKNHQDRIRCSEGWFKYHGFRLTAAKIRLCDGCQALDEDHPVLYISCRVRKCAQKNGVQTCAHCSVYPCEDVNQVGNASGLLEKVENRMKSPVAERDYRLFIEPYEGIKHLDRMRASLRPRDIKEMSPVSLKARIVDFPGHPALSRKKTAGFRALHGFLKALNTIEGVSYARKEALNSRRMHLLKILWGLGLLGRIVEGEGCLEMDSETYSSLKLLSYPIDKVKNFLAAFSQFGASCRLIAPEEERWLTPTGALKKGDWHIRFLFEKETGGEETLRALKKYARQLDHRYREEGFKHFVRADMRCLEVPDD